MIFEAKTKNLKGTSKTEKGNVGGTWKKRTRILLSFNVIVLLISEQKDKSNSIKQIVVCLLKKKCTSDKNKS